MGSVLFGGWIGLVSHAGARVVGFVTYVGMDYMGLDYIGGYGVPQSLCRLVIDGGWSIHYMTT